MDFLPLDRSGNRRFLPVLVKQEEAEVHILQDEADSRAYIEQVWAEAMCIYRSGNWELKPSPEVHQQNIFEGFVELSDDEDLPF